MRDHSVRALPLCLLFAFLLALPLPAAAAAGGETALPPAPNQANLPQRDKLQVTADESRYDKDKDCFILEGHVRINIGDSLVLTCSEAEITPDSRTIWAKGSPLLTEGDCVFSGDAVYINVDAQSAWFYGHGARLTRPGISIRSDTMGYAKGSHLAIFDGHVVYVGGGKEKVSTHLEYNVETGELS